jgi:hypothetical protein
MNPTRWQYRPDSDFFLIPVGRSALLKGILAEAGPLLVREAPDNRAADTAYDGSDRWKRKSSP